MSKMSEMLARWAEMYNKAKPGLEKTGDIMGLIGLWLWRLRKFFMAIPIVWLALYLARLNYSLLPDMVGLDLQTTGEYARMITRDAAVYGPLAVTAVCLLMMFLSRRTLYPWLIALFSMALPVLILITNIFPG